MQSYTIFLLQINSCKLTHLIVDTGVVGEGVEEGVVEDMLED